MDNIVDGLTKLISEITQIEEDNKKLNDDILEIEKERAEGYESFNTETRVLVQRGFLRRIANEADEATGCASYASEEANSAETSASDASSSAEEAKSYISSIRDDINSILSESEVSE